MSLPIPGEINARRAAQGEPGNPEHLLAIRHAAVILAQSAFLRVAKQIDTANMVMMPNFSAADTAEILLGGVRAGSVGAVSLLMVDPLHLVLAVQPLP
jgi:hypothetical protein